MPERFRILVYVVSRSTTTTTTTTNDKRYTSATTTEKHNDANDDDNTIIENRWRVTSDGPNRLSWKSEIVWHHLSTQHNNHDWCVERELTRHVRRIRNCSHIQPVPQTKIDTHHILLQYVKKGPRRGVCVPTTTKNAPEQRVTIRGT